MMTKMKTEVGFIFIYIYKSVSYSYWYLLNAYCECHSEILKVIPKEDQYDYEYG